MKNKKLLHGPVVGSMVGSMWLITHGLIHYQITAIVAGCIAYYVGDLIVNGGT